MTDWIACGVNNSCHSCHSLITVLCDCTVLYLSLSDLPFSLPYLPQIIYLNNEGWGTEQSICAGLVKGTLLRNIYLLQCL